MTHFAYPAHSLSADLVAAGLEVTLHAVSSTDRLPEMRNEGNLLPMGAVLSVLRGQSANGVPGAPTMEELAKASQEMIEELENGAYYRCDIHQYVARKKAA
jgi:hypothetical protein